MKDVHFRDGWRDRAELVEREDLKYGLKKVWIASFGKGIYEAEVEYRSVDIGVKLNK